LVICTKNKKGTKKQARENDCVRKTPGEAVKADGVQGGVWRNRGEYNHARDELKTNREKFFNGKTKGGQSPLDPKNEITDEETQEIGKTGNCR